MIIRVVIWVFPYCEVFGTVDYPQYILNYIFSLKLGRY